jgi:hypothetical protein
MTRVCSVRGLGILVALLLGVASAAMAQASPAMPNPATSQFEA